MKRATGRVLSCVTAAVLLAGTMHLSAPQTVEVRAASTAAELGDLIHYNGLIFGEFVAHQADVEGALAVGGKSKIGTGGQYDVGAAHESIYYSTVQIGLYQNPNRYPSLLLGDEPTIGRNTGTNYINIYGGPVEMSAKTRTAYQNSANKFYIQGYNGPTFSDDGLIEGFFRDAYTQTTHTANILTRANDSSITIGEFLAGSRYGDETPYQNQYLTGGGSLKILSVNVTTPGYVEINSPRVPTRFSAYDLIVFNFPEAASVHFTGGSVILDRGQINTSAPAGAWADQHATLKQFAEKIVWNLPNAESVQITSCGVVGSVIAPEADVFAKGGSINGMLIADGFETSGGMELHAFRMRKEVFDLDTDHDIVGEVEFIKVDRDNGRVLEGAAFELYRLENGAWQRYPTADPLITDLQGYLLITDLPEGEYRLVEIQAPPGYVTSGYYQDFVIDEDNGVYETLRYQLENDPMTTRVTLKKVDSTNPSLGLEGAVFTLFRSEMGRFYEVGDYVSEPDGSIVVDGLTEGLYHLVEMFPPDGYEEDPGIRVEIDVALVGNSLQVSTALNGNATWNGEIPNDPITTPPPPPDPDDPLLFRVLFSKVDVYREMTLTGAEFRLEQKQPDGGWDVYANSLTTNAYGYLLITDLPEGDYRLIETVAPPGYQVNPNNNNADNEVNEKTYYIKEFTLPMPVAPLGGPGIGASGPGIGYSSPIGYAEMGLIHHTLYNKPDGMFTARKVDAQGNPLAGAEFTLYFVPDRDDPDDLYLVRRGLTSDRDGIVTLRSLPPGDYVLRETSPPPGYLHFPSFSIGDSSVEPLLPPLGVIHFTVDGANHYHAEFDIPNIAYTGEVQLIKVGEDNPSLGLGGAEFEL